MIKTSGHRVSPQEVEEAALATGLVAEAVALGLPDAALGQAIHLVCRAMPGVAGDEAAARGHGARPAGLHAAPRGALARGHAAIAQWQARSRRSLPRLDAKGIREA
jgi:acyl-coenzyme A synthetase/AMP-(fatty) acid ligase